VKKPEYKKSKKMAACAASGNAPIVAQYAAAVCGQNAVAGLLSNPDW
jgi:hypothetical protein